MGYTGDGLAARPLTVHMPKPKPIEKCATPSLKPANPYSTFISKTI
jgi:hypothetical protein